MVKPELEKTKILGCIYRITLAVDGRTYVGQTRAKPSRRWADHKKLLRKGCHYNDYLQKAWSHYGESAFEFAVLEPIQYLEDLAEAESRWMNFYGSTNRQRGFNLASGVHYGVPASDSTKEKLRRLASKPENIAKRLLSQRTEDFRARCRKATLQRWDDDNYRVQQSKDALARWKDHVYVERQSAAHRAAVMNPEYRRMMSDLVKQRNDCPEYLVKLSDAAAKSWQDDGIREKRMAGHRKAMSDPDVRQRISDGVKRSITPEMLERRGRSISEAKSHTYELISPRGEVFTTNRIRHFCLEHGLTYGTIANAVTHPDRKLRCGWKVRKIDARN